MIRLHATKASINGYKVRLLLSMLRQPYELVELDSVTCCGAGDIHEAEPDYYLHLNARILAYAEQTGCDTLMTICNVCTLNLRQANWQLRNDDELRTPVRVADHDAAGGSGGRVPQACHGAAAALGR